MLRKSVGVVVAAVLLAIRAHAVDPAAQQFVFTGASVPGQNTLSFANNVYSFTFTGDETLIWQIDLADPKVAGGMLRIREVSSNSYPIDGGGPAFRDAAAAITYPNTNYKKTTLSGHSMSGGVLTLNYVLNLNGTHPYRYEIRAQGKQLRVRALDPTGNLNLANNFQGLAYMKSTGVENPVPIRIQGALAHPITMFRDAGATGTEHWFVANYLDMFQSNATDYRIGPLIAPNIGVDSTTFSLDTASKYEPLTNGKLAAALDDTFLITVSSRVRDVFLDTTAPDSPYRSLLVNRMVIDGPTTIWTNYDKTFDRFFEWGLFNLAGYFFFDWTTSDVDPPSQESVGPDWSEAFDTAAFESTLQRATAYGHLFGAYTAFNCMPATAPTWIYDAAQIVVDSNGAPKLYPILGFPLIGVEASAAHALSETAKLAELGANVAYLDIQTFGSISKGPDGGHIDQRWNSPWSKTMRTAYVAQKEYFDGMRENLRGPLLGEGSIGTPNANMEFANYGYVDSVQRVINTGGAGKAALKPAGSPEAPTNFQIVPEYEWRVAARRQVNHGNGFYDRFFGPSDGPTIVLPDGFPIYPLTQDAIDLYLAFQLTYGHSGFAISNGTDTIWEHVRYAQIAQTYFLTNALQTLYFGSPVTAIRYHHEGSWQEFEKVIFATETLETFRHIPIKLDFQNGLRMYINHGMTPMNITESGITYTLPARTGWWAGFGNWLVAFSAIAPGTGGERIDYCKATGQYEYFNGRGNVGGYGGITTPNKRACWTLAPFNRTVTEDAAGKLSTVEGTPPLFNSVIAAPAAATLHAGDRIGLKSIGLFTNGAMMDFTTLLGWYSTNPGVAKVSSAGIVTAVGPGKTKIVAVGLGGGLLSNVVSVTVN